jgi:hypothetical protein
MKGIKTKIKEGIDRLVRRTRLYREMDRQLFQAIRIKDATEAENCELAERVAEISRQLCQVTVQRPPDQRRILRICLHIDSRIIEDGFLHGNDALIIDYIGRDIGIRAAHEIRRANFQRWEM